VYVEAALALARRVLRERPTTSVEERIRHAFQLCVTRPPGDAETAVLRRLFDDQLKAYSGNDRPARDLIGEASPAGVTPAELAAWYAVAAALLNLDEAITKG
jgi:hypothetical protein